MNRIRILIAVGAVLVLGAVNFSIYGKERIKRDGEVMFLDLQPRDPRSLMQGDYMTLRFRLAQEIDAMVLRPQSTPEGLQPANRTAPREGDVATVPIVLDEKRIASLAAGAIGTPLNIRYRIRNNEIWLGTNGFFFQEGSAERYSGARYGEFRLDRKTGEAVLVGLRGPQLEPL
jgi:uncharacterized membrane-anchored protein